MVALNKQMLLECLAALDDDAIEYGGEKQVIITECPKSGQVYLTAKSGHWKGRSIGKAYNPCDAAFGIV